MLYNSELIQKIIEEKSVVIYGAGVMGKALKICLTSTPYNLEIASFLVESKVDNPDFVDNIPVVDIACAKQYKSSLILVALHEKHIASAMETLKREGFLNLILVSFDSDLWSDIRGNWFLKNQLEDKVQYLDLSKEKIDGLHLYEVHSVADRIVKESLPRRSYEMPIQVGAALTEKSMFSVKDNQGEHISGKNRQYCELTALYWIWKNDKSEYVGLEHYRRKFVIDEKSAKKDVEKNIDVIVTVPILNFPSVRQQYACDHDKKDWDVMLEAIQNLYPEYEKAADTVQNGIYYYGYNMFIARRDVFERYCEWLFPILFYCEEKIGSKTDRYQNRYIGFLAERLLTIFLAHNRQYKIGIAQKHFMESI